jgi:SAM-dependent methyltransferase
MPHYNAHCLLRDFERARAIAPYGDDARVGHVTRMLVSHGSAILQTHKLAATDREHVAALLDVFDLPQGAGVLDAGCGVEAVAEIMASIRPDLDFTLLNISGAQLEMAPAGMAKVRADIHVLPFRSGGFDAVMFNYSLGHGLLDTCLAEAARVLRPGGIVLVYDLATDDHDYLIDRLGYRPHSRHEVLAAAGRHGLSADVVENPPGNTDDFIRLVGSEAFAAFGFARAWPMVYRFTKVSA